MTTKRTTKKRAEGRKKTTGAGTLFVAIALGEDSTRQFKRDVTKPEALAAEMARRQNPP